MNVPTEATTDLPPTRTLAKLYEKQGLLKEAADMYRRLIRMSPEDEVLKADLERLEENSGREDVSTHSRTSGAKAVLSRLEKWRRAISVYREGLQAPQSQEMAVLIQVVAGPREDGVATGEDERETDTWADLKNVAAAAGLALERRLCNSEEAVLESVSELSAKCGALILGCQDVAVCGEAVKQVLSSLEIPVIEVYPANIYKDDPSVKPVISAAVTGQLVGFGDHGYALAVRAAADMIRDPGRRETSAAEERR